MGKPWLLDLFCGAGGAGMGYAQRFRVVGVDIAPQANYPFDFYRGDAMEFPLEGFDVIHASPPCQAYSMMAKAHPETRQGLPDLYVATRERLREYGAPWVIENVTGAPYESGLLLCGSMFGLRIRRHRVFESSEPLRGPRCDHQAQGPTQGVWGHGGNGAVRYRSANTTRTGTNAGTQARSVDYPVLMGMPWARPAEAAQGIPPSYTRHVARQLLRSR